MNLRKIMYFSLGPIGISIIGIISVPLLTWLFDSEDIGRLSMLQLVNTFAVLFFTLGLDQAYIREYSLSTNKSALLKSTILPGVVALIFLMISVISTGESLSNIVFGVPSIKLSFLIAFYIVISFFSRFLSLILRMKESGLAYSSVQILPKLLFLVILVLYYFREQELGLEELVYAQVGSLLLVLVVYMVATKDDWQSAIKQKVKASDLKPLIMYGYPLLFSGIAYWGLTSVDKVMLRTYSSYTELGIYTVAVNFAAVAMVLRSIFSTIWAPMIFKWTDSNDQFDKVKIVGKYLNKAVMIVFLSVASFSWLIDYILPEQYDSVKYILIPCLSFPLLYTISEVTVVGITIVRKTSYALIASVLALLTNTVLCYFLVPIYGASGAAISTSFSFFVFLISRTEFSNFVWRRSPSLEAYLVSSFIVGYSTLIVIMQDEFSWGINVFSAILLFIYLFIYFVREKEVVLNLLKKII